MYPEIGPVRDVAAPPDAAGCCAEAGGRADAGGCAEAVAAQPASSSADAILQEMNPKFLLRMIFFLIIQNTTCAVKLFPPEPHLALSELTSL